MGSLRRSAAGFLAVAAFAGCRAERAGPTAPVSGPAGIPGEGEAAAKERAARAKDAGKLPVLEATAVEVTPILLAPDFGAARAGTLAIGDPVQVLFADHEFLGIQAEKIGLAYVAARAVSFVPPRPTASPEPPAPPPGAEAPTRDSPSEEVESPPFDAPEPELPAGPLRSLPEGAEPPIAESKVPPVYPEAARKFGIRGEVELRIVVETNGRIGEIEVVGNPSAVLAGAARDAARKWRYRPARVNGQPVAVWLTVRVKFDLGGG